ncbi:MAG: tyrosine-type recombinase/integrase [Methanoregulaceae archaeon]|jgi:site-specific recombinase XerD
MADVYAGIEGMRTGIHKRGRPFKQNTQYDYIRILKQFLLWMIESEYISLPEKKVRKIQTPPKDTMTKKAGDLLTSQEVQAMVDACRTSRDRALILTLYEGGFRVGEIGQLHWGDLKVDSKGIAVNLDFKTGIPRYIRLVMSKQFIAEWRADYPRPVTPDAPVFLTERDKPVTYGGLSSQIKRIAKRAGITKRITPHLFRHTRITHLLQEGMKESTLKMMMWGSEEF